MKTTDWCFRWNIEVTLLNGDKIDFSSWEGDIYDLNDILEKHEIHVSNSTLYGMTKSQERVYPAKACTLEHISPHYMKKIGGVDNVAGWHLKIGRHRPYQYRKSA